MYKIIKRILDILLSVIALIICSPLLLVAAIAVKFSSPGPVLFKQGRVGLNNKVFIIYKFRTMKKDTPEVPTNQFSDAKSYITPVGRLLRKSSVDELPQLWNVLRGDMSLVGPRPGAANGEDELRQKRLRGGVFSVRPGITGWAQVNGRDELAHDINIKTRYDKYYVDHLSFWMDVRCIVRSFHTVATMAGYNEGDRKDGGKSNNVSSEDRV